MFQQLVNEQKIPPNFLNSILTNNSLYDMFKNDYEANLEYFQNRNKEEYINAILEFIENKLFSKNLFSFNEYSETLDDINASKVLNYLSNFYNDFLLKEYLDDANNIFKNSFLKGLEYAFKEDKYANKIEAFHKFYNYVFKESINYEKLESEVLNPIIEKLKNEEKLNISEFDTLCNYVKNNINGYINMDLVTIMIKNHAYKTNHIFDREVVKCLIKSTAKDYFQKYGIICEIKYDHLMKDFKDASIHEFEPNIIIIDNILIDTFISGNYVELFNALFYEMTIIKNATLLKRNELDFETLKVIMKLIIEKVDLNKIFVDSNYEPYTYYSDMKSSAFIKTLKFYQTLGVDLFANYINNRLKTINELENINEYVPKKEISLSIMFENKFIKLGEEKIKEYLNKYKVLNLFYNKNGYKKRTLELVKKFNDSDSKKVIIDYLYGMIITPEEMIDDVTDLLNFNSKNNELNSLIENTLKYVYVDSFYYSLDNYIKLNTHKNSFDKNEYLDDLIIKINCIKDTPLSHRFIDEALFIIEETQQNS